jgi:hypothetical protein
MLRWSLLMALGIGRLTSFVSLLNEVLTLLGLLVSHTALVPAATRNRVAGTTVRMVSSKYRVKSKDLSGPW